MKGTFREEAKDKGHFASGGLCIPQGLVKGFRNWLGRKGQNTGCAEPYEH